MPQQLFELNPPPIQLDAAYWDPLKDGGATSALSGGRHLEKQKEDPRRDVEEARPAVQAQLDDNFFQVRIGRTTAAERRYISAMASLGEGPYKTGDIAATLGVTSPGVAPLRNHLINKGLVYSPSHGITD